jgi:predicted nuclease with TOPRIM domain
MEAQMDALEELIASKTQRVEMVNEDDDLAELADKSKIKAMQKEIKDLEKRRAKMEKVYEKMCGKSYVKQEIVDEVEDLNEACGACGMTPCEC